MLKIPTAGDRPPPLVASLRVTPAEERTTLPQAHQRGSRRHSKKSRHSAAHEWDSSPAKVRRVLSLSMERRQMFWMLIGGAALFALIVAGVLMATRSERVPLPPVADSATHGKPETVHPALDERTDAAFLAEAEPLAKKFLAATRIEDQLTLVRHPEVAETRMRGFYQKGAIDPPGLAEFNIESTVVRRGTSFAVKVRTRGFEEKYVAYVDSKQGLRIDWESWVGWSAMRWDEFLASKPTTARVFRVRLNPADYYNFQFSDDRKWQAYQIISPDGGHSIYGYAERGSDVCAKLPATSDTQQSALMLALKFPVKTPAPNQVLIDDLVAEGWVLENEPPP